MVKLTIVDHKETEKAASTPSFEEITAPTQASKLDELGIEKQKEFAAFVLWLSIPAYFKRPPQDRKTKQSPSVRDFCEQMGVEDDVLIELAELRTQEAFCEHFDVNKDTLSIWKEKAKANNMIADILQWAQPMTRNVVMSHYNSCIRGGLPEHYKLWYQFVAGWSEKSQIDIRKREITTIEYEIIDRTTPQ